MALAIFDLDNTLLAGDSDHLWGAFLSQLGVVDGAHYRQKNDYFYQRYLDGTLDIHEFLRFSLQPLTQHSLQQLEQWRRRFLAEQIEPIILPAALQLLDRHRRADDTLLIITATNAFVTAPIAKRLGVPHLLATDPELLQGRYTGEVAGVPCFREGKVRRLESWLTATGNDLNGSCFYSDSHNDIPLLEKVDRPVAVDPDQALADHAANRGWPIISLREAR